jgi:CheY-like chemotaxis protein/HPt (histidine-containing phosphotransfer) domain-containing protein
MTSTSLPRILLVEDDPVSRAFLTAAARGTPAEVDAADSVAAATALAGARQYDLWLFDANLPDGSGSGLLDRLRARGLQTPALAHTAAQDREILDALMVVGFVEVLVKPLPAAAVQGAIRRALGVVGPVARTGDLAGSCAKHPVWDDDAAARALNGNRAHIATLRGLFIGELPNVRQRIATAARAGDFDAIRADLHRLRASCGFVGAARLGAAAQALHHEADSSALLARFDEVTQDTLDQPASPGD